jgi:hypothetical protein
VYPYSTIPACTDIQFRYRLPAVKKTHTRATLNLPAASPTVSAREKRVSDWDGVGGRRRTPMYRLFGTLTP